MSLVAPGEPPLLFDLGTGLRYFGQQQQPGPLRANCLLTHLHWDHTQGLPFFTPLLRPGSELDVYGPIQDDGHSVHEILERTIRPPLFPISIDQFPGTLRCHDVADDDFRLGAFDVMTRLVPHVGPTLGFRVTWRGVSVVYISDHQQPYDGSHNMSDGVRDLVTGADLLIHDAQYTPDEFAAKATWGHCTSDYAVWLAAETGVKTLALFHHDPTRDDDAVDRLLAEAQASAANTGLSIIAAREGMVVELAPA